MLGFEKGTLKYTHLSKNFVLTFNKASASVSLLGMFVSANTPLSSSVSPAVRAAPYIKRTF